MGTFSSWLEIINPVASSIGHEKNGYGGECKGWTDSSDLFLPGPLKTEKKCIQLHSMVIKRAFLRTVIPPRSNELNSRRIRFADIEMASVGFARLPKIRLLLFPPTIHSGKNASKVLDPLKAKYIFTCWQKWQSYLDDNNGFALPSL